MNNTEAREKILAIIKEKGRVSASDINYSTKGKIPNVQTYGITKKLAEEGVISIEDSENNKFYSLADKKSVKAEDSAKTEVKEPESAAEQKPTKVQMNKGSGRDLTKYKFNGNEYNKSRLAHAIVAQYAKDKRPSLKAALEMFPDEIVRPYGFIKPANEAKKISKERARFFIKEEEQIKIKDAVICVSNQMTPERIAQVISIAKKELKYTIK